MTTIVLLATAWGSKHGGINVVNMELARALAEALGLAGRLLCVVPHAEEADIEDAKNSGVELLSLGLFPAHLPDYFDPGWIGTTEKKLKEASGVVSADWCIGHDAISGSAANLMKKNKSAGASAVISHMNYAAYQGVKHEEFTDTESKIREQEKILKGANVVIAVGPLLHKYASDVVDRLVPFIIPGLSIITPRPRRHQFVAVSFGRFERANDRIKQIQLAAEGLAEARRLALLPGGPTILRDNPTLKLIGVSKNEEESRHLLRVMKERAKQIVNLRPMPYKEDRQQLYDEIAGSSVALMLSWHEGFGLTGWEAIAAEIPLIVTEQSGLYQFLYDQGLSGFVRGLRIKGSFGDDETPNFTDDDRTLVAEHILDVARESDIARIKAKNLKEQLVAKGFTWSRTARDLLAALGIDLPPRSGPPPIPGDGFKGIVESAAEPGPTLATYLASVRQVAGQVTLAGDNEPRPLQDVFVELEVTRAGEVDAQERNELDEQDPNANSRENLALQTELRRRKSAPWRQLTETIAAEDLLDLAHRTLIVGAAGTGKSTLLRWLACEAAKRRESDSEARIPVWLRSVPSYKDLEGDFAGALAKRALACVTLEAGPSEAMRTITEAIVSGRALLLIDGLDESGTIEQAHAAEWLEKLEGRVVLASRPLLGDASVSDVVTVTLHGIPGIAAEQLLKKYFAGADWVDALLEELRALPDGQMWLETPVLLGLAATLYRSDKVLPRETIDLYGRAIELLLRSERLPKKFRGDALRAELRIFARERLLPRQGAPRVVFEWSEVPPNRQELYKLTGLFEGGATFRFTHLTLGERLAAEADIDLVSEREKLRAINARVLEGSALEVVPMAHALRGSSVLQQALAEARDRDLSDHRLLRFLLRAIGYGGTGVHEFCRTHAGEVIRVVAERLEAPSGRFGDAELALMDAAERAFLAMRGLVDKAEVESVFARLLRGPGGVGTEAHVATWILGARNPERRESDLWPTVERQALALVRANLGIDDVIALTRGEYAGNQLRAACDLAKYPDMWPRLRPLIHHEDSSVRGTLSGILAKDADSEADWRERLSDENEDVRKICVISLSEKLAQRAVYLPFLRDMLARDPSDKVKASVIDALADDAPSRTVIRKILAATSRLPERSAGNLLTMRNAAVRALATDPESEELVQAYVGGPRSWFHDEEGTLQRLARVPKWHQLLLNKLAGASVDTDDIKALGEDPDAEPILKVLLDSSDESVVKCAITTLGARADRIRLIQFLADDNVYVRCAAITALGMHDSTELVLREYLAKSVSERIAAAEALARDVGSLASIQDNLLRYPDHNVRLTAIRVLSKHPIAFAVLREYFVETRSNPESEWLLNDASEPIKSICHGVLRAQIIDVFARDPRSQILVMDALGDPHPSVRVAAVRALAETPLIVDRLREMFFSDSDGLVCETICELMAEHAFARDQLLCQLNSDLGALRFATFRYLVDHAGARESLRDMLSSPVAPDDWRETIIGPLMRDPESMDLVRACVHDDSRSVRRQALHALKHDRRTRQDLRERARSLDWLKSIHPLFDRSSVSNILERDPEAHPILASHLDVEDAQVLAFVVQMLRDYPPVRPKLVALLDHPSVEVQGAAIRALGSYEPVRARLIAALGPGVHIMQEPDADMGQAIHATNALRTLRSAAADALKDVPDLRTEFRALLANTDKEVREAAIHAVSADRSPEALLLLRERLGLEEEASLRFRILQALRRDPASVRPLCDRLQNDNKRAIRKAAAYALGQGDLSSAYPLRGLPSVARVVGTLCCADVPGLEALINFLKLPRRLDMDAELELGEDVLAWLCARLTWAYEVGYTADGQILGEVERSVARISSPGGLLVIRVAMDAFDLPRERFLRPNHNLMEVWEIARHLVALDPPTVVLACGDVVFEHLQPPSLNPGEVRFGPTFFGFRISRSDMSGADGETGRAVNIHKARSSEPPGA